MNIDRGIDLIFSAIPYFIIGLVILGVVGMCSSAANEVATKKAFMNECVQYEKEYECIYKWESTRRNKDIPVVYSIN